TGAGSAASLPVRDRDWRRLSLAGGGRAGVRATFLATRPVPCVGARVVVLALLGAFVSLGHAQVASAAHPTRAAPDLQVVELQPGVWLQTSWHTLAEGTRVSSNGLVVVQADSAVLVDTTWDSGATRELLAWIAANLRVAVKRAIITHAHDDRMGGAAELVARGIPFVAHPLTCSRAAAAGKPVPDSLSALSVG